MNKKLFFTGIALLVYFGASAQIEKGKILAGGSVGLSSSTYKEIDDGVTEYENTTVYLWIMPRVGYFITEALAAGAGINLSMNSTKYEDDDVYTSSSVSFTPFVRYYLPQGFFGQVEFGLGGSTDKWKPSDGDVDTDKYKLLLWSLAAGYAYFLNSNVAIEPMVSYTVNTYSNSNNTNFKDKYGVLMLQIGFIILLNMP